MKRTGQDMLNDIEILRHFDRIDISNSLWKVYTSYYFNKDEQQTFEAIQQAKFQHPIFPFDFKGFGIKEEKLKTSYN